jgi:GTP 3',8-cyclase
MLLKSIYRIIHYKYSLINKNYYNEIMKIYLRLIYFLKYKNSDMFNDVNIETTTACNRRCENCPNSIYDRSLPQNEKLLPEELFKRIIDDLRAIKFTGRISPHSFGEPLMDKRLEILMKYAHEYLPKAKLEIYTNGDLLDINILNNLYDAGVKNYVITLYGNQKEVEANEKRMTDLKKYIKENKKEISMEINKFSNRLNLSNRGGIIKIHKNTKTIACQAYNNPLVINYKGDVVLCCNDYFGQITFGNIENNSLLEIWSKKSFKTIRKEVRENLFRLDICQRCIAY